MNLFAKFKKKNMIFWNNRLHFSAFFHGGLFFLHQSVGFGLVRFYGMSTIAGYLIPNPLYTYISNIYDLVGLGWIL